MNSQFLISPSAEWRGGKWTMEERRYAQFIIDCFQAGYAPDSKRTTLRCYLAGKLNCNPMRISKKFPKLKGLGLRMNTQKSLYELSDSVKFMMQMKLESYRLDFLLKEKEIENQNLNELKCHHDMIISPAITGIVQPQVSENVITSETDSVKERERKRERECVCV
mmetsp:Transcript_8582/g.8709  ORF Transcript_8582/g.8709 Transcript_8582/m.8709 type:complete len:165 (+) Transcript_8582:125-619(+)